MMTTAKKNVAFAGAGGPPKLWTPALTPDSAKKDEGVNPAWIAQREAEAKAKADYRQYEAHGGNLGLGKKVAAAAKRAGQQVKRSLAVVSPILLGPGLGEAAGIRISKSAGQTAKKSTLKGIAKTGKVTGTVVQVVGTAVATYFGGPVLGKAAHAVTGYAKKGGAYLIKKEQYKEGFTNTKPSRPNLVDDLISGVGAVIGALVGAGNVTAGIGGAAPAGDGPADGAGASGGTGAPGAAGFGGGLEGIAGTLGVDVNTLLGAVVVGGLLLAAWYATKGK